MKLLRIFMLAGLTRYELWVLRLDDQGHVIWERKFGRGTFDAGTSVVSTTDGGAVVVGVTSQDGYRKDDAWVLRLDSTGKLVWEYIFGGLQPDTAWSVLRLPNDGFAVVAVTSSYGSGSADAMMLRINENGRQVWRRVYGGKQWDRPTAAAISADGSILITGYTTSQGAGYEDFWLIRVDANGRF